MPPSSPLRQQQGEGAVVQLRGTASAAQLRTAQQREGTV